MNILKTDLLKVVQNATGDVSRLKFPDIKKIASEYSNDYTVLSGVDGNDTQTMKNNSLSTFNKWKKMKSYANIGMITGFVLGAGMIMLPYLNAISKESLQAINFTGLGLLTTSFFGGGIVDKIFANKANDAGKQFNVVNKWENFASQLLAPQRELTFDC